MPRRATYYDDPAKVGTPGDRDFASRPAKWRKGTDGVEVVWYSPAERRLERAKDRAAEKARAKELEDVDDDAIQDPAVRQARLRSWKRPELRKREKWHREPPSRQGAYWVRFEGRKAKEVAFWAGRWVPIGLGELPEQPTAWASSVTAPDGQPFGWRHARYLPRPPETTLVRLIANTAGINFWTARSWVRKGMPTDLQGALAWISEWRNAPKVRQRVPRPRKGFAVTATALGIGRKTFRGWRAQGCPADLEGAQAWAEKHRPSVPSVAELARALGVNYTTLYWWVSMGCPRTVDEARAWAEANGKRVKL